MFLDRPDGFVGDEITTLQRNFNSFNMEIQTNLLDIFQSYTAQHSSYHVVKL